MFVDPVTRLDLPECVRRAEACGISGGRFQSEVESVTTAEELEATIEKAHRAGVFGVPTFVVDGELFWGNDRLVLVRHYLLSRSADR